MTQWLRWLWLRVICYVVRRHGFDVVHGDRLVAMHDTCDRLLRYCQCSGFLRDNRYPGGRKRVPPDRQCLCSTYHIHPACPHHGG